MQVTVLLSNDRPMLQRIFCAGFLLMMLSGIALQVSHAQGYPADFADSGRFNLKFGETDNPQESKVRRDLDDGSVAEIVGHIDAEINLLESVDITFLSVPGLKNPFYNTNTNEIVIPYGFVVEVSDIFGGDVGGWFPSAMQLLLHEIGHALIDVNRIEPVRSGENIEVVADQLAFFVMSEFYDADEALRTVEEHYRSRPVIENAKRLEDASGDHLPNKQRADKFACWIQGKRQYMAGVSGECRRRYEQLVDDWDERLAPSWTNSFDLEGMEYEPDDGYEDDF